MIKGAFYFSRIDVPTETRYSVQEWKFSGTLARAVEVCLSVFDEAVDDVFFMEESMT